jgi:hypothetical protein
MMPFFHAVPAPIRAQLAALPRDPNGFFFIDNRPYCVMAACVVLHDPEGYGRTIGGSLCGASIPTACFLGIPYGEWDTARNRESGINALVRAHQPQWQNFLGLVDQVIHEFDYDPAAFDVHMATGQEETDTP